MLFAALARELRDPGPGRAGDGGLYLGLLLMHLWRERAGSRALPTRSPPARRPRSVSVNWSSCTIATISASTIMRACSALRAPICMRLARARSAARRSRLVHERLIAEARVRLRDTGQTAEQIAYGLGFRDPAYFSRFFARRVGMSPGAYRKASRVAPPQAPTSFAAWP